MSTQWYALHSKPMKEALLQEQLSRHEIQCYYPCIRVQPANPRSRRSKPYFPGYLFVRLDLEQETFSMFRWLPGAAGIVSFGEIPAHVPDNLIAAIQRRVEEINLAGGELLDSLKTGDIVVVQDGPFREYEAVFDTRLSGTERVRILLNLLNKKLIPLELPTGLIQRKKQ
jgi:transcription elongation factor/antiterminator RfaH